MVMKKIHVGTVSYANEAMDEVSSYVRQCFTPPAGEPASLVTPSSAYAVPVTSATRMRREIGSRVRDVVLAAVPSPKPPARALSSFSFDRTLGLTVLGVSSVVALTSYVFGLVL